MRAGTVFGQVRASGETHILLVGSYVNGADRQDVLKAEAVAEFGRKVEAEGIEFSADIAALGVGELMEFWQLSGNKSFSSSIKNTPNASMPFSEILGRFVVCSYMKKSAMAAAAVEGEALTENDLGLNLARVADQNPNRLMVLVTDFDEEEARQFAEKHFRPRILIYRSTTDAPRSPFKDRVGTLFVTPGFHGKQVVSLTYQGNELQNYSVTNLGPDVPDDSGTARIYNSYLSEVGKEHLLDAWPRLKTAAYAGSAACKSCHREAYRVWEHSAHSRALLDLKSKGHALDPDCVSCHVIGLSSTRGYRSQVLTPKLAAVGCESCHGPAEAHVLAPRKASLKKASFTTCEPCHTPDNSPGFNVKEFWPKIRH